MSEFEHPPAANGDIEESEGEAAVRKFIERGEQSFGLVESDGIDPEKSQHLLEFVEGSEDAIDRASIREQARLQRQLLGAEMSAPSRGAEIAAAQIIPTNIEEYQETPLEQKAMIGRAREIITDDVLADLKNSRKKVQFLRVNGQASVQVAGSTKHVRGQFKGLDSDKQAIRIRYEDELATLEGIHRMLENTQKSTEELIDDGNTYFGKNPDGNLEVRRGILEEHMRWLSDGKRTGGAEGSPRRELFEKYLQVLQKITVMNGLKKEMNFRRNNGSIFASNDVAELLCRDPDDVKNAGKMALLLVASALLALWTIRDIRNGEISFGTMFFIGAVLFLSRGSSRYQFLASKEFQKDTKERIGKKEMEMLQSLAVQKPAAYKHLMDTLNTHRETGIPEDKLHLLTRPKRKTRKGKEEVWVDDPSKQIDEKIARIFLDWPGAHATTLGGIRKTARDKERGLVVETADQMHRNGDTIAAEMDKLRNTPTAELPTPENPPADSSASVPEHIDTR